MSCYHKNIIVKGVNTRIDFVDFIGCSNEYWKHPLLTNGYKTEADIVRALSEMPAMAILNQEVKTLKKLFEDNIRDNDASLGDRVEQVKKDLDNRLKDYLAVLDLEETSEARENSEKAAKGMQLEINILHNDIVRLQNSLTEIKLNKTDPTDIDPDYLKGRRTDYSWHFVALFPTVLILAFLALVFVEFIKGYIGG